MLIKAKKFPFSPEELRELLDYNPETGVFIRKVQTSNRIKVGEEAGNKHHTGYRMIRFKGGRYLAHRLAWYYVYGVEPKEYLDHINGTRDDNRISNLREATWAENQRNRGKQISNTSAYKGVSFHKRDKKFCARCCADGKRHHLGYYDTAEAAHEAYKTFATKHHGDFANIN
jgi:hypothetical protein